MVFATVFLDLIGFGIILPLLPFYVGTLGGSAQMVGALLATFSLSQLLATPGLGRLSDRHGRRPIIALSLAGNATSMVIFAAATVLGSLPLLLASRCLAGATAGNLACCQAAVADVTEDGDRSRAMGLIGAAIGLGMIVGPLLGAALSRLGAWVPPLAAAALSFLDLMAALVLLPETRHLRHDASGATVPLGPALLIAPGGLFTRGRVVAVLAIYFLTFVCFTNVHTTMPLLAELRFGWDGEHMGWLFGIMGAGSLFVQGLCIGPLVRRFGATAVSLAGLALLGAAMLGVAGAEQPPALSGAALAVGLGIGLVLPSLATVAADLAGPHERGLVLGFAQSAGGLGRTVGPVVAGLLYTKVSPASPFLAGSLTACIALGAAVLLHRRPPRA